MRINYESWLSEPFKEDILSSGLSALKISPRGERISMPHLSDKITVFSCVADSVSRAMDYAL